MLRIHKKQLETFNGASVHGFEDEMVAHVARYFPGHHRVLGERRVRSVVDHAIRRARAHGFDTERNICLYLTLMLMLGSNFDVDVQLPWAAARLDDPSIPIATLRMDGLVNEAMTYLDRIAGPSNKHLGRALLTMRKAIPQMLAEPGAADAAHDPRLEGHLQRVFPRKYEAVGARDVRRLIASAAASALGHGLTSWRGSTIYVAWAFILGSAFDTDPQVPWAAETLTGGDYPDGDAKATRLYEQGMAWLDAWLLPAGEKAQVSHV